jgi:hypothetical protein
MIETALGTDQLTLATLKERSAVYAILPVMILGILAT